VATVASDAASRISRVHDKRHEPKSRSRVRKFHAQRPREPLPLPTSASAVAAVAHRAVGRRLAHCKRDLPVFGQRCPSECDGCRCCGSTRRVLLDGLSRTVALECIESTHHRQDPLPRYSTGTLRVLYGYSLDAPSVRSAACSADRPPASMSRCISALISKIDLACGGSRVMPRCAHTSTDSGAGYSAVREYSQHLDVLDVGHDEPERRVHCEPDVVPSLPERTPHAHSVLQHRRVAPAAVPT
jgi:hypothetical protein